MNKEFAQRLEEAEVSHWASLLEGLAQMDDNPYKAEVRHFGGAVALICPGMPKRSFVNRLLLAETPAEIDEAVGYFREKGLPCRIDVTPFHASEQLLLHLWDRGFRVGGFQVALYLDRPQPSCPQRDVHLAETKEQREFAARALPTSFGETDEAFARWLVDSMRATVERPGWRTYVADAAGVPAAFAQLHVAGTTGCLALAGTLPEFRGMGLQTSLIRQRISDAAIVGCDLVCTQTGSGTVSQHNMERAGFPIAYTKAEFVER